MRVLLTGAYGFVGRHVRQALERAGHLSICLVHPDEFEEGRSEGHVCDLRDAPAIENIVRELQPDACVHLGGIAFVPAGWSDPHLVFSVNTGGTVNLLEAFRHTCSKTRILVVSSSEVYGRLPSEGPISEDTPLRPANLYAVSKVACDLSALLYARRYGMCVMTARPQNHIGPGQSQQFVTASFAAQLADIHQGCSEPVMRVGNLESKRDFLDVRDVAAAYRLILERGTGGAAYNISSGRLATIRSILEQLCRVADVNPRIEVDPERYRPADEPPLLDTSRIQRDVGWTPGIPLEQTLTDIYAEILAARSPGT